MNVDLNWFDETSLGTTGLAKREKAFDRLGIALEEELSTVLYLHNIHHKSHGTGSVSESYAPKVHSGI